MLKHLERVTYFNEHPEEVIRTENARWKLEDNVLYILGSDDFEDMLQNFGLGTVYVSGGKFHAGFAEHAETVIKGIHEQGLSLNNLQAIVGYSLGGACAQYIGVRLGCANIYSIASPRCWISPPKSVAHHTRIASTADPVPNLPPRVRFTKSFPWISFNRRWKHFCHREILLQAGKLTFSRWLTGFFISRSPFTEEHYAFTYERSYRERLAQGHIRE